MEITYGHTPVMCEEILFLLAPVLGSTDAVMVDATLGAGGHARAVLELFGSLRVIGIDRDPEAIAVASVRLAAMADRLETYQATFDQVEEILAGRRVEAVLFDLGLSSLQIDSPQRGFAYAFDAPLSMRMDGGPGLTAADVVNTYSCEQLTRIMTRYGEERYAARIARAIVAARHSQPFATSAQLVEVIVAAIPASRTRSGHPAKRVFQALRMEVNNEQDILRRAIPAGLDCLKTHGRMAVLSYHSGEDRIVKRTFARAQSDQAPPGMAVVPEACQAQFRLVTRGAVKASTDEMMQNPRSKPARLRVIERIKEKP